MKTIKIAALALMLCASVVTYAKPGKERKIQTVTVAGTSYTVERDGTVKNAAGEVIGQYTRYAVIVTSEGKIIGASEKPASEKIGNVYFAD